MKTYADKQERAIQQHKAVEKSKGLPPPSFNKYIKMRKAEVAKRQKGMY